MPNQEWHLDHCQYVILFFSFLSPALPAVQTFLHSQHSPAHLVCPAFIFSRCSPPYSVNVAVFTVSCRTGKQMWTW